MKTTSLQNLLRISAKKVTKKNFTWLMRGTSTSRKRQTILYGKTMKEPFWKMQQWTLLMTMKFWKTQRAKLSWSGMPLKSAILCRKLTEMVRSWRTVFNNQRTRLVKKLKSLISGKTCTRSGDKRHIYLSREQAKKRTRKWFSKLRVQTIPAVWSNTSVPDTRI